MGKINKQVNCTEHIALACSTINSPLKHVETIFCDKKFHKISYSHKEEKYLLLEIRFETATLTCLFDENKICGGAFLFLDDLADITYYIEYCNNERYSCDFVLKNWIVDNCSIQINVDNPECSLSIMQSHKEMDDEIITWVANSCQVIN